MNCYAPNWLISAQSAKFILNLGSGFSLFSWPQKCLDDHLYGRWDLESVKIRFEQSTTSRTKNMVTIIFFSKGRFDE